MANLSPQPYKGTRDYYPEDKRIQNYIFSVWRKVAESFGYEEYGSAILEPLEIYTAKSGQELANDQTYSFVDRGGGTVAIRPEMTPTISRMIASRRQELAYPARLYSIANFMRYERPQRGREREFWQLNVDIFGLDGVVAEAEIITMSDKIMKEFGAKPSDYIIKINNRKLINFMMAQYLNLDATQAQAMIKLLDRKNKIDERDFMLQTSEIFGDNSSGGLDKVKRLIDANSMADLPKEIIESSSVHEIRELFTLLERFDVDNITFDITLMRGLDYYTGTVFEVYDTNPENSRALFGGGRYDGLVNLFGVDPISAVGMAPGGTTTEDFLVTHNLLPKLDSTTDLYIAIQGDVFKEASRLASDLRYNNLNVEQDFSKRKLDRQIKTASKKSIPYVLFIGEEEVASGIYPIKDIISGEEKKLNINEIVDLLKSR